MRLQLGIQQVDMAIATASILCVGPNLSVISITSPTLKTRAMILHEMHRAWDSRRPYASQKRRAVTSALETAIIIVFR